MQSRTSKTGRRLFKNQRGQSLVEFSLVIFLLCMLTFGIMDFGRFFFTQMTLQHAVREAGRYAVTGQRKSGTNPNTGKNYTRVESITDIAQRSAAGINVSAISVSSSGTAGTAGGPSQTVTISLTYTVKFLTPMISQFFPNGQQSFTVQTTFKNEKFPASQTS